MTYEEKDAIVEKIAEHDDTSIVEDVVNQISKDYFIIDKESVSEILKNDRDYKEYDFLYRNCCDLVPERLEWQELKNHADGMYRLLDNLVSLFGLNDNDR